MENNTQNTAEHRYYVASRRYDYVGIEEYVGDSCLRTVITGIKPHKLGREFADLLNAAYAKGREDAFAVAAAAYADETGE